MGRPKKPEAAKHVRITCYVKPSTRRWLLSRLPKGTTVSRYASHLLDRLEGRHRIGLHVVHGGEEPPLT